jgi:hypothetical protein
MVEWSGIQGADPSRSIRGLAPAAVQDQRQVRQQFRRSSICGSKGRLGGRTHCQAVLADSINRRTGKAVSHDRYLVVILCERRKRVLDFASQIIAGHGHEKPDVCCCLASCIDVLILDHAATSFRSCLIGFCKASKHDA